MLVMNIHICKKNENCFCCKGLHKSKVTNRGWRRGELSPLFKSCTFWQPMVLPQIGSFTTCLFGGLGSLCCKGLLTSIFWWKSMATTFGFVEVWVCIFSILPPNGDWSAPKYGGENQGNMCHPNLDILYYLYMFIWPLDVSCELWYCCYCCEFHQHFMRALSWDFWGT